MINFKKIYFNTILSLVSLTMRKSYSKSNSLNDKLIDNLISDGVVKSASVEKVMRQIDRGDFTSYAGSSSYNDCPQGIGYSATISAPHMHGWALVFSILS